MTSPELLLGDHVIVGGASEIPGVVQFLGTTQFADGTWVGVELPENRGKNDGSLKGIRYFQCDPKRGVFLRESVVKKKTICDVLNADKGCAIRGVIGQDDPVLCPRTAEPELSPLQVAAAAYESEWAQRFEEQQLLLRNMYEAQAAAARVGEQVRRARLQAEAAERAAAAAISPEAFGISTGAQLERRVLAGLDCRLDHVIKGAAEGAVGGAFAQATQELAVAIAELRQRRAHRASVEEQRLPLAQRTSLQQDQVG